MQVCKDTSVSLNSSDLLRAGQPAEVALRGMLTSRPRPLMRCMLDAHASNVSPHATKTSSTCRLPASVMPTATRTGSESAVENFLETKLPLHHQVAYLLPARADAATQKRLAALFACKCRQSCTLVCRKGLSAPPRRCCNRTGRASMGTSRAA